MTDFSRFGALQAVTYTVKVVVSKMARDRHIVTIHHRKYHMAYLFVPFQMNLDDPEGHWPNAGLIKCNSTNVCAIFCTVLTNTRVARSLGDSGVSCPLRLMLIITIIFSILSVGLVTFTFSPLIAAPTEIKLNTKAYVQPAGSKTRESERKRERFIRRHTTCGGGLAYANSNIKIICRLQLCTVESSNYNE